MSMEAAMSYLPLPVLGFVFLFLTLSVAFSGAAESPNGSDISAYFETTIVPTTITSATSSVTLLETILIQVGEAKPTQSVFITLFALNDEEEAKELGTWSSICHQTTFTDYGCNLIAHGIAESWWTEIRHVETTSVVLTQTRHITITPTNSITSTGSFNSASAQSTPSGSLASSDTSTGSSSQPVQFNPSPTASDDGSLAVSTTMATQIGVSSETVLSTAMPDSPSDGSSEDADPQNVFTVISTTMLDTSSASHLQLPPVWILPCLFLFPIAPLELAAWLMFSYQSFFPT